jgi:poly(beta-D-mannuronate) lyase
LVTVFRSIMIATLLMSSSATVAQDRTPSDLGSYVVTDPTASFFDVHGRRQIISETEDDILRELADELRKPFSCATFLSRPVLSAALHIPMMREDRKGWAVASKPYRDFEDAVGFLSGRFIAGDDDAGECLVDLLLLYASKDAFPLILSPKENLQLWFQIESSLAAAALGYSIVRNLGNQSEAAHEEISDWLVAAAERHLQYAGGKQSCCNNHLYRRGLYASMIGVIADDNDLFQLGAEATLSAIKQSSASGALPLEMARGERAAHYQNFAAMHLALIGEIYAHQGYDLFGMVSEDKSLVNIFSFAQRALINPEIVNSEGVMAVQDGSFAEKQMYLAWLEILDLHRLILPEMISWKRSSFYNRSLGGHLTLLFRAPKD